MSGLATHDCPPVTGYLHPAYADSLAEFGVPYELPLCRGWILKRQIPGSTDQDAIGCYPLFTCQDWSQLNVDLDKLGGELVSLSLVASPPGTYDQDLLRNSFPDVFLPFKEHFVVDLSLPRDSFVHPQHQRKARKALSELRIEASTDPVDLLDEWVLLYRMLVQRHAIKGIAEFSEDSFHKQLRVPGIRSLRAIQDGLTLGMLLWYVQGNTAYYHLGAYSERGYEMNASFGLFSYALDYFAQSGLRWLQLGAGAGIGPGGSSGLSRFKAGWATGSRTAYFCGKIFDQKKYDDLVRAKEDVSMTGYFPAYRTNEFA